MLAAFRVLVSEFAFHQPLQCLVVVFEQFGVIQSTGQPVDSGTQLGIEIGIHNDGDACVCAGSVSMSDEV